MPSPKKLHSNSNSMTQSLDVTKHQLNSTNLHNLLHSTEESAVQSLHADCETKRNSRRDSLFGDRRASRIKDWVAQRLKELETQNEKLRTQNLKCAQQLRLLKNCAENSALARSRLMTNSLQATLPGSSNGRCGKMTSPTVEWPRVENQQRTASYERMVVSLRVERITALDRDKENEYSSNMPKSNPCSPRVGRHLLSTREGLEASSERTNRTSSLPRQITQTTAQHNVRVPPTPKKKLLTKHRTNSREESLLNKKPVPKPRRKESDKVLDESFQNGSTPRAVLVNSDLLQIERDSLEVDIHSNSDNKHESVMDITDSMCNLMLDRDSILTEDYVNINDMQLTGYRNLLMDVVSSTASDDPPPPPKHKETPSWEKRLQLLAQQCLGSSNNMNTLERHKVLANDSIPYAKQLRASGDSDKLGNKLETGSNSSSNMKPLPMFTTRNTMGASPTLQTVKSSAASTSTEPDSSPYLYTSGGSGPGTRSSGESSSKRIRQLNPRVDQIRDVGSSSEEDDYAYPPDACPNDSPVELTHTELYSNGQNVTEKRGFVTKATDGRMKTWQRRWMVLSNNTISLFKSKNDESKQPLGRVLVGDVTNVKKSDAKNGYGFQIVTGKSTLNFAVDSLALCDSWIKAIESAMRESTNETLASGEYVMASACAARGWVTKVKLGHSKRCYASLLKSTIVFTKSSQSRLPLSQLNVHGATVQEVVRSSDDSGSDDASAVGRLTSMQSHEEYSICLQLPQHEPIYLVFQAAEEKDKWLYHLKLASNDGIPCGTTLEVLIQRIMSTENTQSSDLWFDILLTTSEKSLTEPMTTLKDIQARKDALSLYKSCHLFCSVPIQATIEYHVDLAQTVFRSVINCDALKTELFAQLIKLSCCVHSPQMSAHAWKLLCLGISLFLPSQYAILWLLKSHLQRTAMSKTSYVPLALYCQRAMQRCGLNGPRREGPSRFEVMSLILKDPTEHSDPHSIPVNLPDSSYQIIGFDGSTTVQECLESVCVRQGIRHHLYSGYALYADDPTDNNSPLLSLSPKRKICDILSHWEQQLKGGKCGKVPTEKLIRLSIKQRFFWSHLISGETEKERLYCMYTTTQNIKQGFIPLSPDLAEEICALLCQINLGDCDAEKYPQIFDEIVQSYYPARLLVFACRKTLSCKLQAGWFALRGMCLSECSRLLLGALRQWKLFGSEIYAAKMKWKADEPVYIALNETGVHLLSQSSMELLNSYSYQSLVNFGGLRDDFVLTISRSSGVDEEPGRERLVFSMPNKTTLAITMHIADYIRARRLVWYPGLTPRKYPTSTPKK